MELRESEIRKILIRRDGITEEMAEQLIGEAVVRLVGILNEGGDPFDLCQDCFGLEPDYLDELIDRLY